MKISLARLFLILVVLGSFLFLIRPNEDPDFWWHIKTGQIIVEQQQIPHFDDYSFTANGKPWVAHEWLSEVILYLSYKLGGITFTQVLFSLLIVFAFGLSALRVESKGNPYAVGAALLLGVILSTPVLWARPQIFSLVYASLFIFLLDRYSRHKNLRALIPLPFLMLLWVNQHGAFIVGLGIIGIYLLATLIDRTVETVKQHSPVRHILSKELLSLGVVLFLSLLATLANPNGIKMLLYPFQTVNDQSMQMFNQEWASPNFHERTWIPLAVMYLALIGFGIKARRRVATANILLVVIFGYMALLALKQVSLFAIAAIPVLSDLIASVIPYEVQERKPAKLVIAVYALSILGFVVYGGVLIGQLAQKQAAFTREFYPVQAVEYIEREHITGRIFNSYNWGGYMIWNMYPETRVYMDGRCDMYGAELVTRFVDIYTTRPGWQKALMEDGIDFVLIEPNTYLSYALMDSPQWQVRYQDEVSVLFQRASR